MKYISYISAFCLFVLFLSFENRVNAQSVFINEIHYDDSGPDANECIEIAGPAGTDMNCYQIILYNGSNSSPYDTDNLSGIIQDMSCGMGVVTLCYPVDGIQNGAPDGIVLYNSCSNTVVQFLSYEGTITATSGVANGMTSTNIGVSESGSINNSSLQLVGSGNTYSNFSWQGENASVLPSFGSLNAGQSIAPCGCTLAPEPTSISTAPLFSAVSCNAMQICWTNGNGANHLVVVSTSGTFTSPTDQTTYTANSVFGSGTALGSGFVVYNGSGNCVTVSGLSASTTYHFAVYEFNGTSCEENYLTSQFMSASQNTGACSDCASLTGVLINACNVGGCSEGYNEIVFMNTHDYYVDVADISFNYGSSLPGTTYLDSYTSNSTAISDMNLDAACGTLFIDASTSGPIPPNSAIMVVSDNMCPTAFDWSTLCGYGPVYVVFSSDGSWGSGGNFANSASPCTVRVFQTTIEGCTVSYEYDPCSLSLGADGDFVTYPIGGGAPTSYLNDGCTLPPAILPLQLISFTGEYRNGAFQVHWEMGSQDDLDHFILERSTNGFNWSDLTQVYPNPSKSYSFQDDLFTNERVYYRLKMFRTVQSLVYSGIISIEKSNNELSLTRDGDELLIMGTGTPIHSELFDLSGKKINNGGQTISLAGLPNGIYLLSASDGKYWLQEKIVVSK